MPINTARPQNFRSGDARQLIEARGPPRLDRLLTSTTPDTLTTLRHANAELRQGRSKIQPAGAVERWPTAGSNRFGGAALSPMPWPGIRSAPKCDAAQDGRHPAGALKLIAQRPAAAELGSATAREARLNSCSMARSHGHPRRRPPGGGVPGSCAGGCAASITKLAAKPVRGARWDATELHWLPDDLAHRWASIAFGLPPLDP